MRLPHARSPPSPWQAVGPSSRNGEIWAAALGDKVDSRSGLVRRARRMSGAERRKHSKQANMLIMDMHMLTRGGQVNKRVGGQVNKRV